MCFPWSAISIALLSCHFASAKHPVLYHEEFRPQFHFTPAKGWINDPNGLIYHGGKFHLYYQHNPKDINFADINWGHASSPDLRSWEEHPVAIQGHKNERGDLISPFSGSIVLDVYNTSGLQPSGQKAPLIALYTAALIPKSDAEAAVQSQALAFSLDDGLTWTKYRSNPVIAAPPEQYKEQSSDFRDPQVFWFPPNSKGKPGSPQFGHWVMIVSLAKLYKVLVYRSDDLKSWTWVSEFGPANAIGGAWECPSLLAIPVQQETSLIKSCADWALGKLPALKWVLIIGLQEGGLYPGSSTQYFVGDFDGETFRVESNSLFHPRTAQDGVTLENSQQVLSNTGANATKTGSTESTHDESLYALLERKTYSANWMDHGPDFYAFATYNGLPIHERTGIAWMGNWNYSTAPQTKPWRGAMTIPRQLELQNVGGKLVLVQKPVNIRHKKGTHYEEHFAIAKEGNAIISARGKSLDITMRFALSGTAARFGIYTRLFRSANVGTLIGYDFTSKQMFLDRSNSQMGTYPPEFVSYYMAPLDPSPEDGMVTIRALVDHSSVELFGGQGEVTLTAQIFPLEAASQVSLVVQGGVVHNLSIVAKEVQGIWSDK